MRPNPSTGTGLRDSRITMSFEDLLCQRSSKFTASSKRRMDDANVGEAADGLLENVCRIAFDPGTICKANVPTLQ